ncbi:MAG: MBL fold metallo-hydrolase [Candidatus Paceibacterota bacterium]
MKKLAYIIVIALVVCNIISWSFLLLHKDNFFKVVFFDVGQGDGIFIETPDKRQIVIDGGPDYNLMAEKISQVIPFWDKELDVVILTHSDSDHMNGLLGVLEKYKVKNVLWTGIEKEENGEKIASWKNILEREKAEGAEIFLVKDGDGLTGKDMKMDFIWPEKILEKVSKNDSNNNSLVSRLCYTESCFLFAGDISYSEEEKLLGKNIKTDVLKVSHHGSKYASSGQFLSLASPKLAVIEVGKNSYGHPDSETIKRIENSGAKVVRTDKKGDITVLSDGKDYKIIYQKSGEQGY